MLLSDLYAEQAMTTENYIEEIRTALDVYHQAQQSGDLDTILGMFTYEPQQVAGGMPIGAEAVKAYFEAQIGANSFPGVIPDLSGVRISVDTDSKFAGTFGINATIEPVIYRSENGDRVMAFDMIRDETGRWQFVHSQVLPHPDSPAYSDEILAGAGVPLEKQTMVWTRRIKAPFGKVWKAVSTAEGLHKWWLVKERVMGGTPITIDLRPGGTFSHN